MPRYFFDIHDCKGLHRDTAGEDFDSFDEARAQCQAVLADITRSELPDGELHSVACDLRDSAGQIVYRGDLTYRGTSFAM